MELTTTWKEEGLREGWEKGKQEGLHEGEQKGLQEEAFNLTQRLLTRRVGVLTPDLEEQLRKRSRLQLEQLFDAAYDFTSHADLLTWLANNPPG